MMFEAFKECRAFLSISAHFQSLQTVVHMTNEVEQSVVYARFGLSVQLVCSRAITEMISARYIVLRSYSTIAI